MKEKKKTIELTWLHLLGHYSSILIDDMQLKKAGACNNIQQ